MKTRAIILLLALCALLSIQDVRATETLVFPELEGPVINPEVTHLSIHVVPHTHDDIGWLKTVDQYFYDSDKSITIQGVQYILDSVIPIVNMDADKRFIYVEMGFFKRWWNEQTNATKAVVQKLVQSGQLEFINGGYCMNDEAAVYYEDSIDQMTLGHQFLLQNFNVTPEIGWHIDPFGHASAQAALFAQMGFKAFFFARIDYQDKNNRLSDQGLEMLWIPNTSQGIENAMFTHINYYHYSCPANFDFDVISNDQPIRDDPTLEEYDVDTRSDQFVAWFRQMSASYKSTHLMHTIGSDFEYMAANMNFKNYDKLFNYIRKNPNYNVDITYTTPSEYIHDIYNDNLRYPTKTDDFFPYADNDNAYWTGYFTSRVSLKGFIRQEGKLLQAARRLATQVVWDQSSNFAMNNFAQVDSSLAKLEEAMAINQHHDAATGTSKQAVAEDYKQYLSGGDLAVKQGFLYPYFQEKVQKDLSLQNVQFSMCSLNTSSVFCGVTFSSLNQGNTVLVAIYNSAPTRNATIRIKVPNGNVQVSSTNGQQLPTDVICANSTDATDCDLFFTDLLPGMETNYYHLTQSSSSNLVNPQNIAFNQAYAINAQQSISASSLTSFSFKYCTDSAGQNCYSSAFNLNYNYYEGYQSIGQTSGAYIFRPSQKTINGPLSYNTPATGKVYVGKNLLQIQINGDKVIAVMRIYNDMTDGIELQSFVDSIPVNDGQGKEVILSVQVPSINNNKTFYTDSMGMEMQQRVLNYRPTWNLQVTQPVAGNYYPVQSTIYVEDTTSSERLAIIPDRAQSGASITQGEIELLIHRRLLVDDARGVGEALNELDWDGNGMRQWVTHTLLFTKPNFISTSYRQVQTNNDVANLVLLANIGKTEYINYYRPSSVGDDLDPRIKVLCRPYSTTKFLLRFQNMDEENEIEVPTLVFQNDKFKQYTVVEMALSVNQPKSAMIQKRYNWNGLDLNNPAYANTDYLTSSQFLLRPLEIRSFVVEFSSPSSNEEVIYS